MALHDEPVAVTLAEPEDADEGPAEPVEEEVVAEPAPPTKRASKKDEPAPAKKSMAAIMDQWDDEE